MLLKLLTFQGEIPRLPGQLLPENAAQYALNCDFAHGELRGLRDNALVDTIGSINGEALVSVYTENGQHFFGWPWETDVVKSQVVDDIHYRVFYTGLPGDLPVIKCARTYRNDAGVLTRVIGNPAILGGTYMPPEASNGIAYGGNGNGPDSWLLGIPLPKVQNLTEEDVLTVSLADKRTWPGVPNMKLRVTFFVEDSAGKIVYQMDCSNTEAAYVPANPTNVFPQVAYTNDTSQRGNKIQDAMWPLLGFQTPAPFKLYWMDPPDITKVEIGRTVTIINDPSTGSITVPYSDSMADPAAPTTEAS